MQKQKFSRKADALFITLCLIFVGSLLYLQSPAIQSIYYGCPLPKQKGNPSFFAQFYEDYILSIVFSEVKEGLYIDAGAYDPLASSVTQYFYNKGWHGMNIEPSYSGYQSFVKARPRDININRGVGNKIETLTFYKIANTGLSTFDHAIAEKAQKEGFPLAKQEIRVTTLNRLLQEHPLQKINFIKIDVEGFEKQVLEGLNLKKYRPEVFIIEAMEPRSAVPAHQKWEAILLNNHYQFALFDGLNRYYVAEERASLLHKFALAHTCLAVAARAS